ncbi:MAG: polyphosphate polymerase domain-containing protein [Oscillospiraceae bacterium]|nr:polyphosphate polymerase domain-containing protein [Oscillospiraceae bacterium]
MTINKRHEYKHSLNWADYLIIRSRLSKIMRRDPHAGADGIYRVRSLYFDSPNDRALRDKVNGVNRREKFRMRRYPGGADSNFIVLEKKTKENGLCGKQQARITREQAARLMNGDYSWMRDSIDALILELYSKLNTELLRPKAIVDYIREPFLCDAGNVRVTLDRDIRAGGASDGRKLGFAEDFFDDALPTVKVGDEIVLLEVKYDEFIPDYIVKLLQLGDRQASSSSKYAQSRIYG